MSWLKHSCTSSLTSPPLSSVLSESLHPPRFWLLYHLACGLAADRGRLVLTGPQHLQTPLCHLMVSPSGSPQPASPDLHSSPRTSYPVSWTSLLLAGDLKARQSSNDPFPIPNSSSSPASRPHIHLPIISPSSLAPLQHFQRKVLPVPNLTLLHRLFPVSCICNLLSTSSFLGAYNVTYFLHLQNKQ